VLPRVRWALTPPFHPYHPKVAVYFLWHFPSRVTLITRAQVLPGGLSTGARTFLEALGSAIRDRPTVYRFKLTFFKYNEMTKKNRR